MNKRMFLKGVMGVGVTTLLSSQGEASTAKPLNTATVTKSTLALAEKCVKAGLGQEAAILWEAHKRLVSLPLSVEKPYPFKRDEDEPGLEIKPKGSERMKVRTRIQ